MAELVQIAAIWKKYKPNGEVFYSGKLGDASVLIFNNLDKLKDGANPKLPDMKIFITKAQPKTKPEDDKMIVKSEYLQDDDIPF